MVVLGLVVAGGAHHAPGADDQARVAYVLSGGSYGDLCAGGGDETTFAASRCDICRLVASFVLSDQIVAPADAEFPQLYRDLPVGDVTFRGPGPARENSVRGPPCVV